MRTKKSFFNILSGFANNIILNVLRFVVRTVFVKTIGETYLGINGLLSNILGILALADLGISTAIGYCLYKPLKEQNTEKIKSLMNFYKRAYLIIALVILLSGLVILPFLDAFVSKSDWISGLEFYYLIFLANMVVGYLFSYKRALIIADQNEYKINNIIITFHFVQNILQIIMLVVFKNYTLYLLVQTLTILLENIFINIYINKKYPYLKDRAVAKLDKADKRDIFKNIKALIYHKIGSYFVDSTDNLIISKYVGLTTVGLYSNYYLIISVLNKFINTAIWSISASYGNLNVSEEKEKKLKVYNTLTFIGFVVFSICTVCLINLFNPFIGNVWLGKKYVLSMTIVIIIAINFYVSGMMHVNDAVKSSAGLYTQDKFVPIMQSIINIVFSILFVKKYGLLGVFVGTLISSILPTIIKPVIIYKYIFQKSSISYFVEYIKQLLITAFSAFLSYFILSFININNSILYLVIALAFSTIVPIFAILIVYRKSASLIDIKDRIIKIIKERKSSHA